MNVNDESIFVEFQLSETFISIFSKAFINSFVPSYCVNKSGLQNIGPILSSVSNSIFSGLLKKVRYKSLEDECGWVENQ